MAKKRVVLVSKSADKILSHAGSELGTDIEIILKDELESVIQLLKSETCSLVLLATFKNGFPTVDRVAQVQSVAPMTPIILVVPDLMDFDKTIYEGLNISEILSEQELSQTFMSIVQRYIYSGHGILRKWSLEEVFDYCFPVITTLDYDLLCQTIVDFLKELLMADSGLLISHQEGRGSGFKLHSASGFDDISIIPSLLTNYGERLMTLCDDEPRIGSPEELFGPGGFPDLDEKVKSIFTVKFEMEGMNTVYGLLFLKAPPYPEVLDGDILQFLLKQVRFSLFNSEKGIKVQSLIYIDDLTKLYNARYLKVVLDRELKRSDRYGTPVSILFLDIDYFKRVNDSYGHLVGSRVLCEFGNILNACVRETDTVVRYGGDEFVVILVETNPEQATLAAERMRKAVEGHLFMKDEGLDFNLTVSIGIATYPTHARDKEQLLQMADKAMYRGKDTTRNVVYIAEA